MMAVGEDQLLQKRRATAYVPQPSLWDGKPVAGQRRATAPAPRTSGLRAPAILVPPAQGTGFTQFNIIL